MLIPVKPRILKPRNGTVAIDWSHPLANGLKFAVLFEGGQPTYDLVGCTPSTVTGAPTPGPGQFTVPGVGVGAKMTGTQYHDFGGTASDTGYLGPLTCVWRGFVTSFSGYNAVICKEASNGSVNLTIEWRIDQTTGAPNWIVPGGNASGNPLSINTLYTLGVIDPSSSGTRTVTHYANGLSNGSNPITLARNGSSTPIRIGQRQDGAPVSLNGTVFHVYIWSRVLSAQEMLWVHQEPYAFLRDQPARIVFPKTAAAGSTTHFRRTASSLGARSGARQTWAA